MADYRQWCEVCGNLLGFGSWHKEGCKHELFKELRDEILSLRYKLNNLNSAPKPQEFVIMSIPAGYTDLHLSTQDGGCTWSIVPLTSTDGYEVFTASDGKPGLRTRGDLWVDVKGGDEDDRGTAE